ncbi:MAG TPA: DHH family phosphoesterase [Vicinamibacteria bacterium]|nr:DHH family phosphoesterase [Vicinamibacteria bacterium]
MVSETFLQEEEVWSWAGRKKNGEAWGGAGAAFYGDPTDPDTFRGVVPGRDAVAVVCFKDPDRTAQAVDALSSSRPEVKVLVTTTNGELDHLVRENLRKVSWADMVGDRLEAEIARLRTLERVQAVREVLGPAENVALLVQPDPDPDGIASALALRQVLRRNRATAPIVTFGAVTRPENVAMLQLLDIELEVITPAHLSRFERVALLDVQPNVLQGAFDSPDVVIDHHPEQKGYTARFRDIRASYGATSTILTEYCLAADVAISERLATALLYGIKSDTLFLDRETSKADIMAFSYLYPEVNTNLLRRIEKPELPRSAFKAFSRALREIDLSKGLAYVHLGAVEREDVIPQMAELSLQLEGAGWSAASGLVGDNIVVSVRNAGYQKAAGTVVKSLFGEVGCAGGHQAMAKAIIPLKAFRKKYGSTRPARIKAVMLKGFLEEIECVPAASAASRK